MKIGQPLVLLLGGLLSASSIGCSAASALVRDDRPAAGSSQASGSAERLVSIGRVFENQGRYDQAEVMYRRALKKKPNDPIIRQQIAALVDRRNGRGTVDPMESAIAAADSLNGRRTSAARTQSKSDAELAAEVLADTTATTAGKAIVQASDTVAEKTKTAVTLAAESHTRPEVKKTQEADRIAEERILQQTDEFASTVAAARAAVADAFAAVERSPKAVDATVDALDEELSDFEAAEFEAAISKSAEKPATTDATSTAVTRDQILAVIDAPDENHQLLLSGLTLGDSEETRCLAATLLGECDKANSDVRDALVRTCSEATEERLMLSAIDSQIQRGEADPSSAGRLIELLKSESPDVQAQAASSLRCFTGTGVHKDCTAALIAELSNENADVRAIAALTLGDFPVLDQTAREALEKLASGDPDADVREAAQAAIARGCHAAETTHAMMIRPR